MKLAKKYNIIITLIICLSLIGTSLSSFAFAIEEDVLKEGFDIDAKSAILIDSKTGEVLYEKNTHEKLPPASITKIMLLLLTMEALESNKIKLDDKVVVSSNASKMGGSQVFLEEGETQTVEELITAISLRSANDASVALAEHLSGSIELFVKQMNEKAKKIGMKNTNFKNTTGLPDKDHYSTAYDISIMSKELLKYPKIHEWLSTWMGEIKVGKKKDITQSLVNTNNLIRFYQGANGIKTGYTGEAGYCLSASAKKGNLTLISVVLGSSTSKTRFNETKKLLDYGFATYDSIDISRKGEVVKVLPVSKGKEKEVKVIVKDNLSILTKKGENKKVEKTMDIPEYINAPMVKNQKVGELIIKIDGKEVGRSNLVLSDNVEKASFVNMLRDNFGKLTGY
ncbi:D-alanyl-D-alanine carboxypeptidase DacF [Gottschalkia purinilytica]|uniref:serine-type D-Ala-D-Ala carboxypeptidase n=1 Tax=Gottschalkia purinilytica TaxID=1503 RepID=A0A0L0W7J2_GOTPU|nr:D-alanyl-D-alanine carboxypeptidase family protein [Gottschalkia purinilytica]KNF07427.1 D-alanyl-D-alanine carboxypeptidase DacF [Gottschalkia purinilytica]